MARDPGGVVVDKYCAGPFTDVRRETSGAREATYEAPPNIALVKYWGMRDRELGIPFNSSLSVTLDRFRSHTRVRFDPALSRDQVEINGAPAVGGPRDAVVRFLDRVRAESNLRDSATVVSDNNFPTASGLASSASGFAALAGAATRAAGLRWSGRQLSRLARFGSGSASRSVFGGFVEWHAGRKSDGSDCYARPLYPHDHWPELVDVVVLVEGAPVKEVRSAVAMQASVATSPLYSKRLFDVPRRLAAIRAAIGKRDAGRLFPLIMEECDDFRAVCESTRPSLDYLTATSRATLGEVRALNREGGSPIAGYTHDAGAHVHVFTLERHARRVRARLARLSGVRSTLVVRPGPGGHPILPRRSPRRDPNPRRRSR
ncbi:MAG: diphosphomevalonate decarboxylase [Thermoplasmata archaeon]|nr:diphosphomevalonate decarboxylase [Thermoplasmata archaeon]